MLMDEHERPDARKAFRGSLVMAKLPTGVAGEFVPNSASSQFAILFLPMPHLTEQQTVFGRVIEGMDVISSLRRVDPNKEKKNTDVVVPPDRILSAEVIRRPEKLPEPVYAQ
jgi:peptidylprolyl isomerase